MINEIAKYGDLEENVNLRKYNTYHIDTSTKYLIKPYDNTNLVNLLTYLKEHNLKYLILGNGSNVILSDYPFEGIIIKLDYLNKIEINGTTIKVGAGAMLNEFAMQMIDSNLKGLEWATGIPGTIGGAIVGNAGAYNACIFDFIKSVDIIDESLNLKTLTKDQISYSYRHTSLKDDKSIIVTACTLELLNGNKDESMLLVKDRLQRRLDSQPLDYPNAGSVFRNPEGMYAGKLIEDLGFKGKNINDAYVSTKHANFIINKQNAKSSDIISLINEIRCAVKEEYNIELILEQEIIKW